MNILELEIAIANYYASTDHEIEEKFTVRPDRQTTEELPQENNEEGDVIRTKDTGIFHIWDEGQWNDLPMEIFKDDALLTKEDVNKAIDEKLDGSINEVVDEVIENKVATRESLLAAIQAGKDMVANG